MKKPLCWLLVPIITLLLCACMTRSSYTVEKDGVEYLVDTKSCTISDGAEAYPYSINGDASAYCIQITFPDDFEVVWQGSKKCTGHRLRLRQLVGHLQRGLLQKSRADKQYPLHPDPRPFLRGKRTDLLAGCAAFAGGGHLPYHRTPRSLAAAVRLALQRRRTHRDRPAGECRTGHGGGTAGLVLVVLSF